MKGSHTIMATTKKAAITAAPVLSAGRKNLFLTLGKIAGVKQAEGSILKYGDLLDLTHAEFIPVGVMDIDGMLGKGGGIPRGTLVEFCGESQSGKTWLAMKHAVEYQQRGLSVAFLNIENTFNEERAQAIGIDTRGEKFLLVEDVGSGDVWADVITAIVDSGEYALVIIDSITALIPKDHYDRSFTKGAVIGVQARMVGMLTQRLTDLCHRRTVTTILINQFRMATVKGFGGDVYVKKSSGGESIGFFCHMRFWINKVSGQKGIVFSKDGSERLAGTSEIELIKTRYSTPGLKAEFKIPFGDYEGDPINEFLQRLLKSIGFDKFLDRNIRLSRREYQYIQVDTGEILCAHKEQREFLKLLMQAPAPENKAQKDPSTTAFEFFARKIKLSQMVIDSLIKAANEEPEEEVEYERPQFTDLEEVEDFDSADESEDRDAE